MYVAGGGPLRLLAMLALDVTILLTGVSASSIVEGDCIRNDNGLKWLQGKLSNQSAISCLGQPLQKHNAQRYWGTQFSKDAAVVVYPATAMDVSYIFQAAHKSPFGQDFAFVGGAHSMINASSAYGMVMDLSWMNKTRLVYDFELDLDDDNDDDDGDDDDEATTLVAVEYQGGANWGQVQAVTNGTGYTAVGARVANVGVGGFSTGGGIGFLAGAYGFAVDRLVQMEVVLPCGDIVLATKHNEYSDLFWALQGGSGQFGVVTRFWQEAALEPRKSTLGFYYIDDSDVGRLRQQTVSFFENNKDPFSVVYYSFGFLPSNLANPTLDSYAKRTLLITIQFQDPSQPTEKSGKPVFAELLQGINTKNGVVLTTDYYSNLVFVGEAAYPYGYRRGFYGPQTTKVDVDYISNLTDTFDRYIDRQLQEGHRPYSASFVLQYMFPGLNGHLPASDNETAWPHSVVGHQTLFTPAYREANGDSLAQSTLQAWNQITYDQQRRNQRDPEEMLANYPNYISPGDTGPMVWGSNVERLIRIKQKYDAACLIRNGRVFASEACIAGGWANIFAT